MPSSFNRCHTSSSNQARLPVFDDLIMDFDVAGAFDDRFPGYDDGWAAFDDVGPLMICCFQLMIGLRPLMMGLGFLMMSSGIVMIRLGAVMMGTRAFDVASRNFDGRLLPRRFQVMQGFRILMIRLLPRDVRLPGFDVVALRMPPRMPL